MQKQMVDGTELRGRVEGQVMAIEPKVIFEDGGVGVEDTVICRPGGGEVVTDMDRSLQDVS